MIITSQKPLEEILAMLRPGEKVYLSGCTECAARCATGGEKQVAEMAEVLRSNGFFVTGTGVIEAACISASCRAFLGRNRQAVEQADSILALSCGAGAQTIREIFGKHIHPGNNSIFAGSEQPPGKFTERCDCCGDCDLDWTDGICPFARCGKSLRNGPCGGPLNGKCEVDRENDCAWLLIFERLKEAGRLDEIRRYRKPKRFSLMHRPRRSRI